MLGSKLGPAGRLTLSQAGLYRVRGEADVLWVTVLVLLGGRGGCPCPHTGEEAELSSRHAHSGFSHCMEFCGPSVALGIFPFPPR